MTRSPRRRLEHLLLLSSVLALASCHGSTGDCNLESCGGDVTGSWRLVLSCGQLHPANVALLGCPAVPLSVPAPEFDTITFTQELEYSFSTASPVGHTATLRFPSSCLQSTSCSDMERGLHAIPSANIHAYGDASCAIATTGECVCRLRQRPELQRGTYWIEGATIILKDPDGHESRFERCADGGQLGLRGKNLTVFVAGVGQASADLNSQFLPR